MSDWRVANVTVTNRLGLHARPAMSLVDCAARFSCELRIRKPGEQEDVDGKSIMEIMMLAATRGVTLELRAMGDDADDCLDALKALFAGGFDEE